MELSLEIHSNLGSSGQYAGFRIPRESRHRSRRYGPLDSRVRRPQSPCSWRRLYVAVVAIDESLAANLDSLLEAVGLP